MCNCKLNNQLFSSPEFILRLTLALFSHRTVIYIHGDTQNYCYRSHKCSIITNCLYRKLLTFVNNSYCHCFLYIIFCWKRNMIFKKFVGTILGYIIGIVTRYFLQLYLILELFLNRLFIYNQRHSFTNAIYTLLTLKKSSKLEMM